MMGIVNLVSLIFILIGAINWGLVGVCEFNAVASMMGENSLISRGLYTVIGLAGLWGLSFLAKWQALSSENND